MFIDKLEITIISFNKEDENSILFLIHFGLVLTMGSTIYSGPPRINISKDGSLSWRQLKEVGGTGNFNYR